LKIRRAKGPVRSYKFAHKSAESTESYREQGNRQNRQRRWGTKKVGTYLAHGIKNGRYLFVGFEKGGDSDQETD
jgi:hypothetical protein